MFPLPPEAGPRACKARARQTVLYRRWRASGRFCAAHGKRRHAAARCGNGIMPCEPGCAGSVAENTSDPADSPGLVRYSCRMSEKQMIRRAFVASGQVQGVGFRPFVYRLAHEGGLTGAVGNTSDGVRMEVQGLPEEVERFGVRLQKELPPLARLTALRREDMAALPGEAAFAIVASDGHAGHSVLVSPDVGICGDCLADMADPENPRHNYAFTNCTNCGPRYTITRSIPYDRAVTSMSCFPLCPRCAAEYGNPADRRFHAQPIACPDCGPRLWFVDKAAAMAGRTGIEHFRADCGLAGPEACSGPDADSTHVHDCADAAPRAGLPGAEAAAREALRRAGRVLLDGGILAFKGLGGFQLACDARNERALALLRERKNRPHKPLALMADCLETVRAFCDLSPEHEALLTSPEKPIVLCPRRAAKPRAPYDTDGVDDLNGPGGPGETAGTGSADGAGTPDGPELPFLVAPDVGQVGVMLPNTPLHSVLFAWLKAHAPVPPVLVMTSANAGGEPICLGNREAVARLAGLADAWLLHDRDILVRVDDSVISLRPRADVVDENGPPHRAAPFFYRRARGYVPRPVFLADGGEKADGGPSGASGCNDAACVFGAGAELKATICLTRGNEAFVGQHVGDLENPATLAFYEEVATHMEKLLEVRPSALVCDLHPDFLSTRYAEARAARDNIPLWRLQHHAAHAASVLAENACFGPALALCLDGTGLGDDGTIWGGELLLMQLDTPQWQRVGCLSSFALPGGDAAVREPWRIALALGQQAAEAGHCLPEDVQAAAPWLAGYAAAARAVEEMLARQINCPATSSCGRLFDAVSARLGLCLCITYEGQAAIRLEDAALRAGGALGEVMAGRMEDLRRVAELVWPVGMAFRSGLLTLDSAGLYARVVQAAMDGMPVEEVAARFHLSLAAAFASMTGRAARKRGVGVAALSGGVMQNGIMARLLPFLLERQGLEVLCHHELPPGDGGLSLGQAVWGRRMLAAGARMEAGA